MEDGSGQEVTPGEVGPVHDAEVVGNESCALRDLGVIDRYAKRD